MPGETAGAAAAAASGDGMWWAAMWPSVGGGDCSNVQVKGVADAHGKHLEIEHAAWKVKPGLWAGLHGRRGPIAELEVVGEEICSRTHARRRHKHEGRCGYYRRVSPPGKEEEEEG